MCDIVDEVLALGRISGLHLESQRRPHSAATAVPHRRPNRTSSQTLRRLAMRRARRYGLTRCHHV